VNKGLRQARDEYNDELLSAQRQGQRLGEPSYQYGIIVSAMRMFFKGMSRYYDALYALHPYEGAEQLSSMASLALVQASLKARDEDGIPIVGVDIAGAERGFHASVHQPAYDLAHQKWTHKTVHAGEGFGPESIGQAVRDLHAERIGHGFHLFNEEQVEGTHKPRAAEYVHNLVRWVSDLRITMEVCLTSNLNTMPGLELKDHPIRKMLDSKVSVTLCTDNRLVSNTTTVKELQKGIDTFELTPKQLRETVITGFKRSFYPGPYTERRAYVRQVMDFYDQLLQEHGMPAIPASPSSP